MEEANLNAELHHIACNFKKIPGTIYYVYRRDSGQRYMSMISPEEWGSTNAPEFVAGYKLEHDMSWTPIDKIRKREDEQRIIDQILQRSFDEKSANTLKLTFS